MSRNESKVLVAIRQYPTGIVSDKLRVDILNDMPRRMFYQYVLSLLDKNLIIKKRYLLDTRKFVYYPNYEVKIPV